MMSKVFILFFLIYPLVMAGESSQKITPELICAGEKIQSEVDTSSKLSTSENSKNNEMLGENSKKPTPHSSPVTANKSIMDKLKENRPILEKMISLIDSLLKAFPKEAKVAADVFQEARRNIVKTLNKTSSSIKEASDEAGIESEENLINLYQQFFREMQELNPYFETLHK